MVGRLCCTRRRLRDFSFASATCPWRWILHLQARVTLILHYGQLWKLCDLQNNCWIKALACPLWHYIQFVSAYTHTRLAHKTRTMEASWNGSFMSSRTRFGILITFMSNSRWRAFLLLRLRNVWMNLALISIELKTHLLPVILLTVYHLGLPMLNYALSVCLYINCFILKALTLLVITCYWFRVGLLFLDWLAWFKIDNTLCRMS